MASEDIGDNVIAILTNLRNQRDAVREILKRIAGKPVEVRNAALSQLVILAGLRRLAPTLAEEVRRMPIQIDIMENEILAELYTRVRQEALQAGERSGEMTVLRRLIEKRFGPMPAWAETRLSSCSTAELADLSDRLLDAPTLEDVLK